MSVRGVTNKRVAVVNPAPVERELLAKQFADNLFSIGPAIALAGSSYPLVLAIGQAIFMLASLLVGKDSWNSFGEAAVMLLPFSALGAGIGLVWASIVAVAVLPSVYLFVRSLELRGSIVRLGAFCGGLVGFVAVFPLWLGLTMDPTRGLFESAFIVLIGPALTTIMGQLGGAWGAWRNRRRGRRVVQDTCNVEGRPDEVPANGSTNGDARRRPRLQFGIRHLLVISVWISLLLAAIQLSGLDYLVTLSLLVYWFIYQAVTLWLGGLLIGRFWESRRRRQTRST